MARFCISDLTWEELIKVLNDLMASVDNDNKDKVKRFLIGLAANKSTRPRTWVRLSAIARDALRRFDEYTNSEIKEILKAIHSVTSVAMETGK